MKDKTIRFKGQNRTLKATGFIFLWVIAFVVAVVFTQALRSSVSFVFFILVCAVLPIDLIYTAIAASAVTADFESSTAKAEKNEPVIFKVTLSNRYRIPVPFIEAEITLPDAKGAAPAAYIRAPLTARGSCEYEKELSFKYKGEYSCGVKYVYVGGLLRMFRIRKRIPDKKRGTVTVLPRRIYVDSLPERYVNEASVTSDTAVKGTDSAEIAEIKDYFPGDPIKNIHWKLSTKAQELMTKHFGAENGFSTCVAADNSPRYAQGASDEMSEYCDDAVCEICCSIITRLLDDGRKTALIYNDTHGKAGRVDRKLFDSVTSFEDFLPYFAACMPAAPVSAETLTGFSEPDTDNDIIFVTSRLTEETVAALCETRTVSRAVSVVLFEPYSMINDPEGLKKETETYVQELASADVSVQRVSETELL